MIHVGLFLLMWLGQMTGMTMQKGSGEKNQLGSCLG